MDKITISEDIQFKEIRKAKVKPIAKSGFIPFFRKFLGRIVYVVVPKKEMIYWAFGEKELNSLKRKIEQTEVKETYAYSNQNKISANYSIERIIKSPNEFLIDDLKEVIYFLETRNPKDELITKIKKFYSI